MSASEIRLAMSYSIQKDMYYVHTYEYIPGSCLGYHNPIVHTAHNEYSASLITLDRFFSPCHHSHFS